ncbi:MAG: tetratricopeptide repeat protein [Pirellulaceae bacterium]|jgi:tetratricopeptide (TPR) repeat protein|nr:tetratricopeptide repeat protein [Pirellulaceae bacterium]
MSYSVETRRWKRLPATAFQLLALTAARTTCWTMCLVMCLVMCLASGCARPFDVGQVERFQEAQQVFAAATTRDDYLRAASLYESIIAEGSESSVVLFNLGNAYMRADERGRAVACYLRAQRYRPRDPYVAANLQAARAANAATPTPPIVEQLCFWQNTTSLREKLILAMAFAIVAIANGVAAIYSARRTWRRVGIAFLILTLALVASIGYDWRRFAANRRGVIIRDVVARKGDGATYDPAFNQSLVETLEFQLLDERSDWLFIRIAPGQSGWIPKSSAVTY